MFLSPYYKGEGMFLGRGYYKPKRQRGVGHQFRGDGIIDTQMGIGSTILKHKDLIGSTASAVGNVAGAIKSIKDAQKWKQLIVSMIWMIPLSSQTPLKKKITSR